jgi:hypothetical protein
LESAALNTSCLGTYGIGIRNLTQYRDYIQLTGRVAPPPQYRAVPLRTGRNRAPPPRIDLSTSHPSSKVRSSRPSSLRQPWLPPRVVPQPSIPAALLSIPKSSVSATSLCSQIRRRPPPSPNPAARAPFFFPIVDGGAGYLRPRPGQRNMGGALAELSANQGQRRAWPSPARRCGSIFSGEVNQGRRRAHN